MWAWCVSAWAFDDAVPPVEVPRGTVIIDGVPDDPAWVTAPRVDAFVQYRPVEGGPPEGTTEVRFLYDERALYVLAQIRGAEQPIRARIAPREDVNSDDQVGIYLDPFGHAQNGFVFYLNPRGVQQDIRAEGPASSDWNVAWDTVLRAEGRVTADGRGFDLEVAIPFRSLKYPGGGGPQTWGVLITRKIPGKGAKYAWPGQDRTTPRTFARAAPLRVTPPPRGSGWELIPGLSAATAGSREAPGEPRVWTETVPLRAPLRPSLDLRFGATPSSGLGATINPDFSQVEADETPIDVNNRFAFSFAERRPFFLDGAGYLEDSAGTLHTRAVVDPLYAVKAYAQSGRASFGALHTLDRAPAGSVNVGGSPGFGAIDDPASMDGAQALTTLARGTLRVGEGGSAGLTLAEKEIVRDGSAAGQHLLGGLDVAAPFGGAWTASGYLQGADTRADGEVRSGWDGSVGVDYEGDTTLSTGLYASSPGFRRETGLRYTEDERGGWFHAGRTLEPRGVVDTVYPWVWAEAWREARYDSAEVSAGASAAQGPHSASITAGYTREGLRDARDAPTTVVTGGYLQADATVELTPALAVSADAWGQRGHLWLLGGEGLLGGVSASFTARPTPGVRADVSWSGQRAAAEAAHLASQRARARVTGQITRALGVRWIEEYVDVADDSALTSSLALTWLRDPGTALYVGYAERRDVVSGAALDQAVYAKATVLLRP